MNAVHATTLEGTNRRDFGDASNQQQQQQHAAQQHKEQSIAFQLSYFETAAHQLAPRTGGKIFVYTFGEKKSRILKFFLNLFSIVEWLVQVLWT